MVNNTSLPQPIGRQKEVLYLPPSGHVVVLGTAGSGKTTLAILRALFLADQQTEHGGPTLLTTFNRCLVTYMKHIAGDLTSRVKVENYHKFARGYLSSTGINLNQRICSSDEQNVLVNKVLTHWRESQDTSFLLKRPVEFFVDEFKWIQAHGINNPDEYVNATRIGRSSSRVVKADRVQLFNVYESYLEERNSFGKVFDWDDLASGVIAGLRLDAKPRRYKHIVIDEGQDFSPEMIRSLAAAIPHDGSLTFFGDIAQQIYGQNMSWRDAGLNVSKVWRFDVNYRNSRQVSRLALALANKSEFRDDPDIVEPTNPVADGPLPILGRRPTIQEESDLVMTTALRLSKNQTVAILYRTANQFPTMPAHATKLSRELPVWPKTPGLFYGTYHAAKGLEFDTIFLPHLNSKDWPNAEDINSFGYTEAMARSLKLLYVGITRAKMNLVMTYSGTRTTLLPEDSDLYAT